MSFDLYTIVTLEDLEHRIEGGDTVSLRAHGRFSSFKQAIKFGKLNYDSNFAIAGMGPPFWEEDGRTHYFEGEVPYIEYVESLPKNSSFLVPLPFIAATHIFSEKIREMTPEEGAWVANYNPEEQLEEILSSRWYKPRDMFVASTPVYCYRVEKDYLGDLYTIGPISYIDRDYTTPRVPLCRKLPSCAAATGQGSATFIYMSVEPLITILPSSKLVHDAPITGERWTILPREDVTFVCVGKAHRISHPKFGWYGELAPIEFVQYGRRPKEVVMREIYNLPYYEVLVADQRKSGIDVKDKAALRKLGIPHS